MRLPSKGMALYFATLIAGWSSPVARQAHNLKVVGSNPTPATNLNAKEPLRNQGFLHYCPKVQRRWRMGQFSSVSTVTDAGAFCLDAIKRRHLKSNAPDAQVLRIVALHLRNSCAFSVVNDENKGVFRVASDLHPFADCITPVRWQVAQQ